MKLGMFLLASILGFSSANAALGARAKVMAKSGSKVKGTVEFKEMDDGSMKVTYNLSNLPKSQTLGMHIHEMADCTSKDGKSAGGHYAHMDSTGGTSTDFPAHYAGDLPAISSDSAGKSRGSFIVQNLSVNGENPINKRSVVIHNGPDDVTQPAAARIACGVIEGPQIAPKHTN